MDKPIKSFISYSHDSKLHKEKVLKLSNSLRTHGIDCEIDQYDPDPKDGWGNWIMKQINYADYVIVIFSRNYRQKMFSENASGVYFESSQLVQKLNECGPANDKIIVAVLNENDKNFIPNPFSSYTCYDVSTNSGYTNLYKRLTGQHKNRKPPLGSVTRFPEQEAVPLFNLDGEPDTVLTATGVIDVEIIINTDFDNYNEADKKKLLSALEQLLDLRGTIKIKNVSRGSVKVRISIPYDKAEELKRIVESGALDYLNVTGLDFLNEADEPFSETDKPSALLKKNSGVKTLQFDFNVLRNDVRSLFDEDHSKINFVVPVEEQQKEISLLKETIENERFFFIVDLLRFEIQEVHGLQKWLGYPEKDFTLRQYWNQLIHPGRKISLFLIVRLMYETLCKGTFPLDFMVQRFASLVPLKHYNGHYVLAKKTSSVFQYDDQNRLTSYLSEFTLIGGYNGEALNPLMYNASGEKEKEKLDEIMKRVNDSFQKMKLFSVSQLQVIRKLAYNPEITQAKIALDLGISVHTVATYYARFLEKAREFYGENFRTVLEAALRIKKDGLL